MTITVAEFERLKKMMGLTFSDNDGEALNALRAANKVLQGKKLTWRDVLERTVTVDVEAAPPEPRPREEARDERVENAFDLLRDSDKWTPFIESLHDQWERKNWLSPKQRAALFRNVEDLK
jgi:hypothetical protein